jgi:hypothetical protein
MAQNNSRRSKLFKSEHIIFCAVIVNAVFWVGLGFFLFRKSDEEKGRDYSIIYKNL